MNKQQIEQERAAFEAWAVGPDGPWTQRGIKQRIGDSYGPPELAIQWDCWQAARASQAPAPASDGSLINEGTMPAPSPASIDTPDLRKLLQDWYLQYPHSASVALYEKITTHINAWAASLAAQHNQETK